MAITYKVTVRNDGYQEWRLKGQLHREDGPAIVYPNGDKVWYINGNRHREDGPAVEHANGSKFWHLDGNLHREDGPAIEWNDGRKEWWLNSIRYTEADFRAKMNAATVLPPAHGKGKYTVYTKDSNGNIFCYGGSFETIEKAREYVNDAKRWQQKEKEYESYTRSTPAYKEYIKQHDKCYGKFPSAPETVEFIIAKAEPTVVESITV